jgi:SAM-dependent methyltransferase
MYLLVTHADVTPVIESTKYFTVEKDNIFLHPPGRREQRSRCVFRRVSCGGPAMFRSRLWLPPGAADVRFGLTVRATEGTELGQWHMDLPGGTSKTWAADLGILPDSVDVELWTEIGPEASGNQKAWARFYEPVFYSPGERIEQEDERAKLRQELNAFYRRADPWDYANNADDAMRRIRLLGALPARRYARVLDIGCGDGFVTFDLPGELIVGTDLSDEAIRLAEQRRAAREDAARFSFEALGLYDLTPERLGTFDLVVITGVLYPQYIGDSWVTVAAAIDRLLNPRGILAACHIHEWTRHRFPYARLTQAWYRYRSYTHCLEVFVK